MKRIIIAVPLLLILSCAAENWELLRNKTENALNNKNYTEALGYLETALSDDPENAEIHYYLGQTYRLILSADGALLNKIDKVNTQKSSDEFKKTVEISPKYTGKKFIADPYSKIQTIWGELVMAYLYENKPDSAKWAFGKGKSEGGFYDAMMEYNKNIMASCSKDAVLFTNGDNDTFPMWYLQLVENYRTDIVVANLSLLNDSWYIMQLKDAYPTGINNLTVNLSARQIEEIKPIMWEEKFVEIPLSASVNGEKQKMRWTVKPTIEGRAVRVQDLMVIEILKANIGNKPIYFSSTVYKDNRIGLDKYLAMEGLVYKVNPYPSEINPEKLYSNLCSIYTYDGVNDKHLYNADDVLSLYQNYHHCFLELTSYYIDAGEKEKAREVFGIMERVIPEKLVPYTYESLKKEAANLRDKL